ncbi:MAG: 2-C-methyl-D-erythritol 2,4-cyclodiphosphate synthase [Oscillospiraceae bacterium]|nr:2-C-methyl-D-erythritol 2,4-cyclodiphosphate synthase [Oscillospiraceae bacterium]
MRVGIGYDVHRFCENRPLIIGGIAVDYKFGLEGHSDADVLVHAVADALLGAAALGDIGTHFPPSDKQYKDIDSCILLEKVTDLLYGSGYRVGNADCVIIAEEPRFAEYIPLMREKLSRICKVPVSDFGIKATTEEGLGLAGRGIGAKCVCVIATV